MVASPEAFAAVIQLPVPSLSIRASPLARLPGAPLARKPKNRLPFGIGCDGCDDLDGIVVVLGIVVVVPDPVEGQAAGLSRWPRPGWSEGSPFHRLRPSPQLPLST